MPVKGLGYDIHGRNDGHADVRKGIDKEAIFLVFATIGTCFKRKLFSQFVVLSNPHGTVNVKFNPKLMGWDKNV